MIHLLRKIRRRLLSENKVSKYFIYALGEIILVVIGILIALKINNSNEDHKQLMSLKASMTDMVSNLEEDLINFEGHIVFNHEVIEDIDYAFKLMVDPDLQKVPYSEIGDSIIFLGIERSFIPSRTAFQMMESSSQFQHIEDPALSRKIFNYYNQLTIIESVANANNQFVQHQLEPLIFQNMEIRDIPSLKELHIKNDTRELRKDNSKFITESVYMENLLISRKFRLNSENRRFTQGLEEARQLLKKIEENYLN